ncbi:unnamed protein product [Bursaphelenchus xylophilus]|uniref:Fucosyltransferase n=1 Tax=Bursaphelenchus xylophilus TaxID=6326 RepID=A0A1I7RMS8_BURXY|nr:unnamed protein product [Bursaphelenchus xylophilus]CAG9125509.1 unnamed protein product [Bursaphelenchus xylophilus]
MAVCRSVAFVIVAFFLGFASFIYYKSEIILSTNLYYNYDLKSLNNAIQDAFLPDIESEADDHIETAVTPSNRTSATKRRRFKDKVEILMWTHRGRFGKIEDYIKDVYRNCGKTCHVTPDRGRLNHSDAVVFYPFYAKYFNVTYPPHANQDQLMVFWEQESPMRYLENKIEIPEDYFNTTVTYMSTSDVPIPYGRYVKKRQEGTREEFRTSILNQVKNQNKGIYKVFSHCKTSAKREELIKQIQKVMPVDLYGKCGNMTCSNSCFQKNKLLYRFYLAFENSICVDYITEKFWQFNTLVPIVVKRSMYPRLPEKSFIALDDFGSLEEFAQYINELMRDDQAYSEYLMWRYDYYRDRIQPTAMMCWLCDYVRKNEKYKWYDKIEGFSDASQSCDLKANDGWFRRA